MAAPTGYIALGAVGYTMKGAYDASATYDRYNVVTSGGKLWVCILNGTTGITPAEGENWQYMLEAGHIVKDADGVEYTPRKYLKFEHATVTDDETNDTTVVSTHGTGTIIVQIPGVIIGTYTYDGTEQSPTITGLDTEHVAVTGAGATDAGDYTLKFHLKDNNMVWADLTTDDITHAWSIAKAAQTLTLSKTSVTLDADTASDTVTVSGNTGALSVESSDTSVATAALSGDTVTIASVDETSGSVTVTVTAAGDDNHEEGTAEISVSCEFSQIYGVEWEGGSSPLWSRTDAAEGFVDPSPAVGNGTGSSPFDGILPWSGMERVTDANGGVLVKIPKFYYKMSAESSGAMKLQISATQESGFSISPAHQDRGDGAGERDYVCVGAYHCSSNDYKSSTGVTPKASITRATARQAISALGSDIWQWDKAMLTTIQMLYLVEFANWNSQAVIGYGCSDSGNVQTSGLCDAMAYHTGTSAASRTVYGHTRYRWIEDLWGNVRDWCDGVYIGNGKIWSILNPANFSDTTGGTDTGFTAGLNSNEIKRYELSEASGLGWFLWPVETISNGNYDTYICDYGYVGASYVVVYVGGGYDQSQGFGLFYQNSYSVSSSYAYIGSRLQKLPSA